MAVALVQNNSSGSGLSPLALAYNSNVTAGNFLTAVVRIPATGGTYTISDNLNGTWSQDKVQILATDGDTLIIASKANTAGGSCTVTVNDGGTGFAIKLRIQEWSGMPTTASILGTNSANNTNVNGNSGNVTVSNALVLSGFALSSSQTYVGAGSTTSIDGISSPGQCGTGYQIVTTSTTTAGQFTFGASDEWAVAVVAYSSGAGGGTNKNALMQRNCSGGF